VIAHHWYQHDVSFSSSSLSNDFNKDHVITCPNDKPAVSDEEDGGRRQMVVYVAAYFSGRSAEFIISTLKIITLHGIRTRRTGGICSIPL